MKFTVVVVAGVLALAAFWIPRGASTAPVAPQAPIGSLIAERAYENQLRGQRAGVYMVQWSWAKHEGQRVVQDITRTRTRTARKMGRMQDVFETSTQSTILRTEDGDLLQTEEVVDQGGREDRSITRRTPTGYAIEVSVGGNQDSFEIETPGPTKVDVEAFLGLKIRSGEAVPGTTFTYRILATGRRTSLPATAHVEQEDEEGPGLRVRVSVEGRDTLWWFAPDGSVMRLRAGDTVIRRADGLTLDDLPQRPAAYSITLPANVDLPRLFTARSLIVDVGVDTDETVQPPKIPLNPFTEVVEETINNVRLRLKCYDSPSVNVDLPIAPDGFEEFLKPTPLMEVDDPELRNIARKILAKHADARSAAAAISDYVFRLLGKGSSEIAQPSAKQILRDRGGDCSEHALLFTALCRSAGIPARRCSGYVCIGGDWGGHAWCEIWVGKWIGADPTTNEIGTRARYIFCGRPSDPTVRFAAINADRTRITIREAEFSDGVVKIESPKKIDRAVFTGIRLGSLPEGWHVAGGTSFGRQMSVISKKLRIDAFIEPDHGYRALDMLKNYRLRNGQPTKFGGRDAIVRKGSHNMMWIVPLGRQNLYVQASAYGGVPVAQVEALLKPTLDRDDG